MTSLPADGWPSHRDPGPITIHEFMPDRWAGRIRRGKLRRPELPGRTIRRPRIHALIERGAYPVTLVVAPAGFGKTMAAAQWASSFPHTGWLTLDSSDTSLYRFWAHFREALQPAAPGAGELVSAALDVPHRVAARELGRLLADELLDATAPVRLVLDELHEVPSGPVCDFLSGLLEMPPSLLRLVVTSRSEPAIPLPRLRIHDQINEIRGPDLLFTGDEIRAFLGSDVSDDQVETLRRRSGGWAAGLRLAAMARLPTSARGDKEPDEQLDAGIAEALIEEAFAPLPPEERAVLLRAAIPNQLNRELMVVLAATCGQSPAVAAALEHAKAFDLLQPATEAGDVWFELQPIFRPALRRKLEAEESPAAVADLHRTIALWFEAIDRGDVAIGHWLAARQTERAVVVAERQIQPALAREDWPEMARWLSLLPDVVIRRRPSLMLAHAWITHLRGRFAAKREIVRQIEQDIDDGNVEPDAVATVRAELEVLRLDNAVRWQIDPVDTAARARDAREHLPADRRFPLGVAWLNLGMSQLALGHRQEAEQTLKSWYERSASPIDAGTIRGLFGLTLLYLQSGELVQAENHARTMTDLAARHQLRLTGAWGHAIRGEILYEQDRIAPAIDELSQVARDHEYAHILCVREALFLLAQSRIAAGSPSEAEQTIRRSHEILIAAEAVEHLPVLHAYGAYVALLAGDTEGALHWARHDALGVDSATLLVPVHPLAIRAAIFCATGGASGCAEAIRLLAELRERATRVHMARSLIRIDALLAVSLWRQGHPDAAQRSMQTSLAAGLPRGFIRTYLDLIRVFPDDMRAILAGRELPAAIRAALDVGARGAENANPRSIAGLTRRELEILAALGQGHSYDEIAGQMYISPHTVKRHASNVYGKLGVSGRYDALRAARALGWSPPATMAHGAL